MKNAINILVIVFFTWPAMFVGYVVEAIVVGFDFGRETFIKHGSGMADWVESLKEPK